MSDSQTKYSEYATIAKLLKAGTEFESISIPISPVLLLQEDFLEELKYIIGKHEIPAGKLAIEIDEYAMSIATVSITVLMQELAELGVETERRLRYCREKKKNWVDKRMNPDRQYGEELFWGH